MSERPKYTAKVKDVNSRASGVVTGNNLKALRREVAIRYGAGWRVQIFEDVGHPEPVLVTEYVTRRIV